VEYDAHHARSRRRCTLPLMPIIRNYGKKADTKSTRGLDSDTMFFALRFTEVRDNPSIREQYLSG
jgi:hypothetical protein